MSSNLSRLEQQPRGPEPLLLRAELLVDHTGIDRESAEWMKFEEILTPLITELPETWQHSKRVTAYALGIAATEGWEDRRLLAQIGLTHDIGKLALPQVIKAKIDDPDLSDEERAITYTHARAGYEMLQRAGLPFAAYGAGRHHLYQGNPYGVDFAQDPWLDDDARAYIDDNIRLIALADHFDSMNTRSYNAHMAVDEAAQRDSLIGDFPTPLDLTRIDWLLANRIIAPYQQFAAPSDEVAIR